MSIMIKLLQNQVKANRFFFKLSKAEVFFGLNWPLFRSAVALVSACLAECLPREM